MFSASHLGHRAHFGHTIWEEEHDDVRSSGLKHSLRRNLSELPLIPVLCIQLIFRLTNKYFNGIIFIYRPTSKIGIHSLSNQMQCRLLMFINTNINAEPCINELQKTYLHLCALYIRSLDRRY